jgi:transcriptional regulator with XRE-family HTH domain
MPATYIVIFFLKHLLNYLLLMKEIAANIKRERERWNYTQEYMATELDISQPAYSKIEAAKTEVSFHQLVKIARILHVDVIKLIREPDHYIEKQLEERVKKLEEELKDLKKMLKSILVGSH